MPTRALKIVGSNTSKQPSRRKRRDTVKIPQPVVESLRRIRSSKVELVTLFNSVDLQKDYGGYAMVYDGRKFRKLVRGLKETLEPTRDELKRFLIDIIRAAKGDKEIKDFIKKNPFPFLPPD